MESPRISIRLPAKLHAACVRAASTAGVELSVWLRGLAEQATGVVVPITEGIAGLSKSRRKAISRQGVEARWGKAIS